MKGVVEVGNRNCRGIERASSLAAAAAFSLSLSSRSRSAARLSNIRGRPKSHCHFGADSLLQKSLYPTTHLTVSLYSDLTCWLG